MIGQATLTGLGPSRQVAFRLLPCGRVLDLRLVSAAVLSTVDRGGFRVGVNCGWESWEGRCSQYSKWGLRHCPPANLRSLILKFVHSAFWLAEDNTFSSYNIDVCTLCLEKVPTFKLSVTLSNLTRKAYEICYKKLS